MWRDTPLTHDLVAVAEVVALVETEMHRPTRAARCVQHDGIEGRRQAPLVMQIGCAQDRGERDAARVGENVPLRPQLRAVGRVRSGELPQLYGSNSGPWHELTIRRQPPSRTAPRNLHVVPSKSMTGLPGAFGFAGRSTAIAAPTANT